MVGYWEGLEKVTVVPPEQLAVIRHIKNLKIILGKKSVLNRLLYAVQYTSSPIGIQGDASKTI